MNVMIDFLIAFDKWVNTRMGYQDFFITLIIILIASIYYKFKKFKNQYSPEGWKIVKKNGRRSVFWYDEDGNITYKKPKKPGKPPIKRY